MSSVFLDVRDQNRRFLKYNKWIISSEVLHKELVAQGWFGFVYRVVLNDDKKTVLAQKVPKNTRNFNTYDFLREFGTLRKLASSTKSTGVDRLVRLAGVSFGISYDKVFSIFYLPLFTNLVT